MLNYSVAAETVDWSQITKQVSRMKPNCLQSVPIFVKLVKEYGGGSEGAFVPEFCSFHRKFVPNERTVNAAFFEVQVGGLGQRGRGMGAVGGHMVDIVTIAYVLHVLAAGYVVNIHYEWI